MTTEREAAVTTRDAAGRAPVRRRFGRRSYQVGAVLCLVAAAQAVILPATGLAPWPLLAAAAVAAGGAVTLAVKSIPYDHVRFPR